MRSKLKESHEAYLEEIIGLEHRKNAAPRQVNNKKLFQYLKIPGLISKVYPHSKQMNSYAPKQKKKLII